MKTAGPYSRAVTMPARTEIPQRDGSGDASRVHVEERGGLVWGTGPDGVRQPCASERVAARVAASVRNLGRA
jgi:hypothetical protein